MCGVGAGQVIEDYMSKMVECLNFLCDCTELSREEKNLFFKNVSCSAVGAPCPYSLHISPPELCRSEAVKNLFFKKVSEGAAPFQQLLHTVHL